ncbi:phage minor capsid protein [Geomicrobium sp. JCM 19055]|uniref:phage minor capsid protein n=1 Tax=Geomicrobium sp. JCM 19055 TaxID=1460649 RepID=UPI00045ED795|nr:phage minor capsid protein [Geomicrobium sp. JCM 19055]GAK00915.1 Rhs family protein [Geomicrobium sp. JCM 19055]
MAFREYHSPSYDEDRRRIATIYARSYKQVQDEVNKLSELRNRTPTQNQLLQQEQAKLRQISFIFSDLSRQSAGEVDDIIYKAFGDGQRNTILSVSEYSNLVDATEEVSNSVLARERIEKLMTDTQRDLLKGTNNTEDSIKAFVSQTVSTVMQDNALQSTGRRTLSKEIRDQLTQQQLQSGMRNMETAIVDRANRTWKLDTYVDMVVRTKMNTAYMDGLRTEMQERDIDLAIVSDHGAIDECSYFEGMIISMRGETRGYPTYDELRQSNLIWHPNCRHSVTPVTSEDVLPDSLRRTSDSRLNNYYANVSL